MNSPHHPIEVLAPAGDDAALQAALDAGAHAVYFGLPGFNARARASNFSVDGLRETVGRIHARGAKGYVTLNTLVFDDERDRVLELIRACVDAGVDALIVQDLGVARWVRELAPAIALHASTQMTCTDLPAIELARSLGVRRVVLPRELSLQEIERIRAATDVRLEVFVHGALCVAYSGQCLASLTMGGRSANRGMCAQPCRLPYDLVVDGQERAPGPARHVLSPSDLDASDLLPRLLDAGVDALKIEGRLKGPAYVAATVRLYRGIVDAWQEGNRTPAPDTVVHEAALQMFSRGSTSGFLESTNHQRLVEGRTSDHRGLLVGEIGMVRQVAGRPHLVVRSQIGLACGDGLLVEAPGGGDEVGGRVWSLRAGGPPVDSVAAGTEVAIWLGPERELPPSLAGSRLFRTSSPRLESLIRKWSPVPPARVPLRISVRGSLGAPALFQAVAEDGRRAETRSDMPLARAERQPLRRDVLEDKLGKLGGTPFELQSLDIDLPDDAILPLSSLNQSRRRLVDALVAQTPSRPRTPPPTAGTCEPELELPAPPPPQAVVLCRNGRQVQAAFDAGARAFVLDLPGLASTRAVFRQLRGRGEPGLWLALATLRVRKPGEASLDHALAELSPDGLLLRSLGSVFEGQQGGAETLLVADSSLNVANTASARQILAYGVRAFTPSWDLDPSCAPSWFAPSVLPYLEFIVHGARPMFHTQHCLYAANLSAGTDCASCDRPCENATLSLRDRVGSIHPVVVDRAGRNTVFEHAPRARWEAAEDLRKAGVRRFRAEFTDETPAQVSAIVTSLLEATGVRG